MVVSSLRSRNRFICSANSATFHSGCKEWIGTVRNCNRSISIVQPPSECSKGTQSVISQLHADISNKDASARILAAIGGVPSFFALYAYFRQTESNNRSDNPLLMVLSRIAASALRAGVPPPRLPTVESPLPVGPIYKSGRLAKMGKMFKRGRRYWYVLGDGYLAYQKAHDSTQLLGVIDLREVVLVEEVRIPVPLNDD